MFPKENRLNKKGFDEVFKMGTAKRTPFFMVKIADNNVGKPRFAVSVPTKIIKNSPERHLYKRRFLNLIKKSNLHKIHKDFVFVLGGKIEKMNYEKIVLCINKIGIE